MKDFSKDRYDETFAGEDAEKTEHAYEQLPSDEKYSAKIR